MTRNRLGVSVLIAVLVCVAGCGGGGSGPTRVAVEGEVTFEGRPVEKGAIVFIPTGTTKGPTAGAVIEGGRYELGRDRGPVVGTLRVEIRAERRFDYDITEPTETVKHIGEPFPENEIPKRYNDESELRVTTIAAGENQFDFHLP